MFNVRTGKQMVRYAPVIVFEGILAFYDESIRKLMDLKIFVYTDDDVRLGRRLRRDLAERGRTIPDVLIQYNCHVKKAYDEFIRPTMKYADVIIPRGRSNKAGIELIIEDINMKLKAMGFSPSNKGKRLSSTYSEEELKKLEEKGVKGVTVCKDDVYILDEVINKFCLEKDPILNK